MKATLLRKPSAREAVNVSENIGWSKLMAGHKTPNTNLSVNLVVSLHNILRLKGLFVLITAYDVRIILQYLMESQALQWNYLFIFIFLFSNSIIHETKTTGLVDLPTSRGEEDLLASWQGFEKHTVILLLFTLFVYCFYLIFCFPIYMPLPESSPSTSLPFLISPLPRMSCSFSYLDSAKSDVTL